MGSPPLTRGKVRMMITLPRMKGITPAYAGKSESFLLLCRGGRDHPRLRGEKAANHLFPLDGRGSPPLTRGKADVDTVQRVKGGITPAYAGKSFIKAQDICAA